VPKIAVAEFKKYKSPGSIQIPSEQIQAGGEIQSDSKRWAQFRTAIFQN
jgi:hypothetical protein